MSNSNSEPSSNCMEEEMPRRKRSNPNFNFKRPCLGLFLQGAVRAVAVIEVGVQVAMFFILTFGILAVYDEWKEKTADNLFKRYVRYCHWLIYYLHMVVCIFLAHQLFVADRHVKNLKSWLKKSILIYLLWLAAFLNQTIWIRWAHPMGEASFAGYAVYKIYTFWVVYSFKNEIQYYSAINFALRELSDEEIEEFINGNPTIPPDDDDGNKFRDKPYKKDFEIPFSRIKIDESNPLGRGAFGKVLKGYLKRDENDPFTEEESLTVAVKKPYNPTLTGSADILYFKALLSELKILTYIGRHENIVTLIGASTSQIKQRQLYIVVEFCPHGSVINYLRANRGLIVHKNSSERILRKPCGGYYLEQKDCSPLNTTDLIVWAAQTASGMAYISSKKVFHGDLSAKNVLLTRERNVKICDFGLSRQLYHYSTYVKHKDEPLPWRWMSPESLCDLSFSSASDVWSYGVTLWEYFTCGSTPYPGFSYDDHFVRSLKSGCLMLNKPPYASSETYREIKRCWALDPKDRPTFSVLEQSFNQILDKLLMNNVVHAPVKSNYVSIDILK